MAKTPILSYFCLFVSPPLNSFVLQISLWGTVSRTNWNAARQMEDYLLQEQPELVWASYSWFVKTGSITTFLMFIFLPKMLWIWRLTSCPSPVRPLIESSWRGFWTQSRGKPQLSQLLYNLGQNISSLYTRFPHLYSGDFKNTDPYGVVLWHK